MPDYKEYKTEISTEKDTSGNNLSNIEESVESSTNLDENIKKSDTDDKKVVTSIYSLHILRYIASLPIRRHFCRNKRIFKM